MDRNNDTHLDAAEMMMRECLCTRVQMASRAVGRRFDEELRPLGINNWQLSIMIVLSQQASPTINGLANSLGMVRTNLTKNLKPLERLGLLAVNPDDRDARVRRVVMSEAGRSLLEQAVPLWQAANLAVGAMLPAPQLDSVRAGLEALAEYRK